MDKPRIALVGIVAMLLTSVIVGQAATPGGKGMKVPTAEETFKMNVLKLAAQMNVFRLSAGFDVDRAVEVWASPGFRDKWQKEVMIGFPEKAQKDQLHDFFSSAVVMVGRYQNGKAVTLFYNPWGDGLLLIAVEPGKEHPVLTDFQFLAGESWRKEPAKTTADFLSLYAAKEPLTLTLARRYGPVETRFNQEYPVDGKYEFLPSSVKTDAGKNPDELVPIVVRLAYRQRMFGVLFSKERVSTVTVVRDLRKELKTDDMKGLAAMLATKQNTGMLENVRKLPLLLRKNFSPNYFTKNAADGSCLVGLVNPEMPLWFLAVRIEAMQGGAKPDITLEVFDLAASTKVVQIEKGGAQ